MSNELVHVAFSYVKHINHVLIIESEVAFLASLLKIFSRFYQLSIYAGTFSLISVFGIERQKNQI